MTRLSPYWPSTTIASNEPVPVNLAFDPDDPAELYWSSFYGDPTNWEFVPIEWTPEDFYNFADLDRVESNTQAIVYLLEEHLQIVVDLIIFTSRNVKRFEFYDSLNRIEGNILTLGDTLYKPDGWEQPKTNWRSGQPFDYRDANRLERNLYLLYVLILATIENLKYCGTFHCGEVDVI